MLIDQVLRTPPVNGELSAETRGRLMRAPKFVIERDFALAAGGLTDKASADRALGLCRLPYAECWFETVMADRGPSATPPRDGFSIRRGGVMLTQTDQAGSFAMDVFWSVAGPRAKRWRSPIVWFPLAADLSLSAGQAGTFRQAFRLHPGEGYSHSALMGAPEEQFVRNVLAEAAFTVAVLALLNSECRRDGHGRRNSAEQAASKGRQADAVRVPRAAHFEALQGTE